MSKDPLPSVATVCLYRHDDHCLETDARVVLAFENSIACNQTCFYPGGGGQPPDEGAVRLSGGGTLAITSAHLQGDVIWHVLEGHAPEAMVGQPVHLSLNQDRRGALARYHTVLHVLNTIALRDCAASITGVQIGVDHSRIDFEWEHFSAAASEEIQGKVNQVLQQNRQLQSFHLSEASEAAFH